MTEQAREGSAAKFCVVPQSGLAMFRQRTPSETIQAQGKLDPRMLDALEEMVRAAREGRLESEAALEVQALAW
jgi:hypothetical protein